MVVRLDPDEQIAFGVGAGDCVGPRPVEIARGRPADALEMAGILASALDRRRGGGEPREGGQEHGEKTKGCGGHAAILEGGRDFDKVRVGLQKTR